MKSDLKKTTRIVLGSALDHAASRAEAATSLVTAAASILSQDFGPDEAIRLLRSMVDEAATDWLASIAHESAVSTRH